MLENRNIILQIQNTDLLMLQIHNLQAIAITIKLEQLIAVMFRLNATMKTQTTQNHSDYILLQNHKTHIYTRHKGIAIYVG